MSRSRAALCTVLALVLLHPAAVRAQQADPLPPNPFQDITAFLLPNGLRVWYRQLTGSGTASVTLAVPYGAGNDPGGKEGTAHLLEHALFFDRGGRTEAELNREVQNRGGSFNASTGFDRTIYYLNIGSENTAFGIRWLNEVIAPREFTSFAVERSREPVAIETGVTPRTFADRIAAIATHPLLRPPGFWMREFGLATSAERDVDAYRALHQITAQDLQAFHETYYVPTAMTLLIVSDQPLAQIQPVLLETFGMLPWRPEPEPPPAAQPRTTSTSRYFWSDVASTELALRYRVHSLDATDHHRLIFLGDLLQRRLFERLRLIPEPAVYSVTARSVIQRDAAFFAITAAIKPDREAAARAVIDEELARLRTPSSDPAAFYRDRDALARQLRLQNGTPAALQQWMLSSFHDPTVHATFPDLGSYYATVGTDSLAAFATRLFADENRMLTITRPLPLSPPLLALLLGALLMGAVALYRRLALVPADMARVRFVGRLRAPLPLRLVRAAVVAVVAAVVLRLIAAIAHHVADRWLVGLDSFTLQYLPLALLTCVLAFAAIAIIGSIPAKVLVFDDHVRLKSRTYRSRAVPADLIRAVRIAVPGETDHLGAILAHGWRPGVLLQLENGRDHFFPVRDPAALLRALQPLLPAATEPASGEGSSDTADLPRDPPDLAVDPVNRAGAST